MGGLRLNLKIKKQNGGNSKKKNPKFQKQLSSHTSSRIESIIENGRRQQKVRAAAKGMVDSRLRDRKTLREREVRPGLCSQGSEEQVHSGIEGDFQGTNRQVQHSSSIEEGNGYSNQSQSP